MLENNSKIANESEKSMRNSTPGLVPRVVSRCGFYESFVVPVV